MRISTFFCLFGACTVAWLAGCTPAERQPAPSGSFHDLKGKSFTDLKANDPDTTYRRKLMFYALGTDLGQRLVTGAKRDGIAVDEKSLHEGLADALSGKQSKYSQEELAEAIAFLETRIAQNVAARRYDADPEFRAMADRNLAASRAAMADFEERAGVKKLPNGVLTKQMKAGTGRYVAAATTLTGNFSLNLANGTLVRESEDGKPVTVKTAKMMPVILDAIQEMRVGATWRVAVPAELAYGLGGSPPAIGPNQALILEIELLNAE